MNREELIYQYNSELIKRIKEGESPLELSIEKHQNNLNYVIEKTLDNILLGTQTCALCLVYNPDSYSLDEDYVESLDCEKCPVYERSGMTACMNTPYMKIVKANRCGNIDAFIKATKDEISFLESLR